MFKCYECGWVEPDESFFTQEGDNLYCSLHIPSEKEGE